MSIFVGIMSFVNVLFLCLGIYSTILVGRRRSMPADKLLRISIRVSDYTLNIALLTALLAWGLAFYLIITGLRIAIV